MRNFEEIGRELERRGKAEDLKRIAESPDGLKISRMVDAKAVESAVGSGDGEALKKLLSQVLNTEEGKRLAESVQKLMGD